MKLHYTLQERVEKKVAMKDFEEAKDKILMGVERKSMVIPDHERSITAYTKRGTLVAELLKKQTRPQGYYYTSW